MYQFQERDGEEDSKQGGHVKRRRTVAKKNGRCTSSRKEMERKTENKVDMSREEGQLLRRMVDVPVAGKRWRGRQKTRWTCQEKKGSC